MTPKLIEVNARMPAQAFNQPSDTVEPSQPSFVCLDNGYKLVGPRSRTSEQPLLNSCRLVTYVESLKSTAFDCGPLFHAC